MQDIAAMAGVHQTTVSLALRNRPVLPEATRERIREIARQLGYRPDPVLGALRARRRTAPVQGISGATGSVVAARRGFSIAFLTAAATADQWKRAPGYVRSRQGIDQRATETGYHVEEFWFDREHMTPRRATQILRARNVSGIVVVPLPTPAPLDLDWRHFACVSLTFSLLAASMHTVCNHHWETIRLACGRLQALGYRRIGLALNENSNNRVRSIWSGGVLEHNSRQPARQRVPPWMPASALPREGFVAWLRQHRPDVILTIPPHLASVRPWLQAEGLRVPADIGVATLDCMAPDDEVSGVYQEPEVIGRTAVDILAGLIQRNDLGLPGHPQATFIRGSWVDGKTTRPQ
ncbi:transcriptional regulator [Opitutaceae bacterium TAV1]|nr:transcriptional regulator [Opitutaceae bacterium TAV1]